MNTENTGIESEANDNTPAGGRDDNPADSLQTERGPRSEPERAATPGAAGKPPRRGGFLAFLALLVSLAALALSAWMWWQGQSSLGVTESRMMNEIARLESNDSQVELKLRQLRDELDPLALEGVSAEFNALQARLQADREQAQKLEQTMREQLALSRSLQSATDSIQGRLRAAEAAVSGLSTRELDAGGELDLAEVDYLLRLANERVKLFADPVAADQALEVADMHLAALDNPMYLGVRQDIAVARRELAELETPDFLAISNQLNEIQQRIPALSFRGDDEEAPRAAESEAAGEGWWEKIKGAFSGLVTVRRSTGTESQRISLQDRDYIRQRIWLQLEIAHLALMRRDQAEFRSALGRARESIDTWFDPLDAVYREVAAALEGLAAVPVEVDVPDITAPWSTLRLLRASPAPPVSVTEPADSPAAVPEDEGE